MQQPPVRDDGLQLEEHRRFQHAFWRVERVSWAVFTLVLLLALAGLAGGGGYFSQRTLALGSAQFSYPRVSRWEASDDLRAAFAAGAETHRLTVGADFLDYFEVETVSPEPERSLGADRGLTLEFATRQRQALVAVLHVRPLRPGVPRFTVTADGVSAEVTAVVLP